VRGMIKKEDGGINIIYGIKWIKLKKKDFKIEVKCINEYEK
jgi:hypothetical protein